MPLYPGVHPPGAPLPKPHHSPNKVCNARLHAPMRTVMCDVRMVQEVQVHMQGPGCPREGVSEAGVERFEGPGSSRQRVQCLAKHHNSRTIQDVGPFQHK